MEKSNSEEFDRDGFIWKRIGSSTKKRRIGQKKWSYYYVNLIGGSLHYYKEVEDQEPKGTVQLNELKLFKDDNEGSSQKFCFALKNDKSDFLFYCDEEVDWKEWTEAIEKNMSKDPCSPLKKEKRKSRAQELAFKLKKNVGGKAANSIIGKKAIKSQTPEEVKNLISSLKHIIERESKSAKKASEIEENIFKIGIKAYFLIDGGRCKLDDFLDADKPLRESLETLIRCHNHAKFSRNVNTTLLREKFGSVKKNLDVTGEILTKILTPHIKKERNIQRIKETTDYLGDADRLMLIFTDPSLDNDLQELIDAAEHYTQFHFYSEKEK